MAFGSTAYVYKDGKYLSESPLMFGKRKSVVSLEEINGENIHDYIKRKEVNINLGYDSANKRVYRFSVSINNGIGEEITATFKDHTGQSYTCKAYIVNKGSYAQKHNIIERNGDFPSESFENISVRSDIEHEVSMEKEVPGAFYACGDNKNNIGYINVLNFCNDAGKELKACVEEMRCYDSIIIDLRNNGGGFPEYFNENLYAPLFSCDTVDERVWYTKKKTAERSIYSIRSAYRWYFDKHNHSSLADSLPFEASEKYFSTKRNYYCFGEAEKSAKVYLLTSNWTGSASDMFTAIMKDHELATVIGNNTAGEGIADTSYIDILPNSRISFMYTGSKAINSDGRVNSVFGTSPDIYSLQTAEGIAAKVMIKEDGVNLNSYTNRLKWDDVLIEAVGLIGREQKK